MLYLYYTYWATVKVAGAHSLKDYAYLNCPPWSLLSVYLHIRERAELCLVHQAASKAQEYMDGEESVRTVFFLEQWAILEEGGKQHTVQSHMERGNGKQLKQSWSYAQLHHQ